MSFDDTLAYQAIQRRLGNSVFERGLDTSFVEICRYLYESPESLSWRNKDKPSLTSSDGLNSLAIKYVGGFRKSDFPTLPGTVPDEMVSIILATAYNYSTKEASQIVLDHQKAMCAENCVGALLERYLDSVLRQGGWHWCCGSYVKAVDFIRRREDGTWLALQIKNRDNSENSSSSKIREGTQIEKWFRTYSRTGRTNWENLPPLMRGYGLSENGFRQYVERYIELNKPANIPLI